MRIRSYVAAGLGLAALLSSSSVLACACGCSIFMIGGRMMNPTDGAGEVYVDYDYLDQSQDWHNTAKASPADNDDKKINTNFYAVGGQLNITPDWTVGIRVPIWNRQFTTDTGTEIATFTHAALGDIRLTSTYTGLGGDHSTGLTFGVKLPSGDSKYANFDSDTEIGTGSTDLLVGGYHFGKLTSDNSWSYFVNVMYDDPVHSNENYRPGAEAVAALGVFYSGWSVFEGHGTVSPILQLLGQNRTHDGRANADPADSGYTRLVLAPAVEIDSGKWKLYGELGVPIYQRVKGDQLTAPDLLKFIVSRRF